MYAALWRILPGPVWVRILTLFVALVLIVTALVLWVFPWIDGFVSTSEGTVGQ